LQKHKTNNSEEKVKGFTNSTSGSISRIDRTPTTATSSQKRDIQTVSSNEVVLIDKATGKPICHRKRAENRFDMELESRGSIFTGRDEA
jgi:hypothetical protein